MTEAVAALSFREGRPGDLKAAFELGERAIHDLALRQGVLPAGSAPGEAGLRGDWSRERPLLEFLVAQPASRWWVCELDGRLLGHALVSTFGGMEELADLMIDPDHNEVGVGHELLRRLWPDAPSPDHARVVVAAGTPADLTLYASFGVMPVTGHWHMRLATELYRERRVREIDAAEPAVVALKAEHAVEEWQRLEPPAIGHERPQLHEFFARTRTCLAVMDDSGQHACGLCWVSADGEIGPAVGASAEDLVPVVLQALDRVATTHEPERLALFCATDSWWLLDRLRRLGFRVFWPSWVMCSVPIPGLDRYLPTRPARIL